MEFLLRKCGTSRNNVKSMLVRKQVLVNGSVVTQYNFPLAKDDEVKLSRKPVKEGVRIELKKLGMLSGNATQFENCAALPEWGIPQKHLNEME